RVARACGGAAGMIIPLAAAPSQEFSVSNGGIVLFFEIRWLTRFRYFVVNVYRGDRTPVTLGRALHPQVNILNGLAIGLGSITLEGADPTPDNLGIANRMVWRGETL